MAVSNNLNVCVFIIVGCVSAHDYFLPKRSPNRRMIGSLEEMAVNTSASSYSRNDNLPCDVNGILSMGDTASYYIFQTYHQEYMSTDGSNVDLYQNFGPHATWHLNRVADSPNTFYLINDRAGTYLHSSGNWNHDNVDLVRWTGEDRDLQWLFFSAQTITAGAPKCTFYIMHSDSHKWLDTHGDNVHIWGDSSDMFAVGDSPQNLQWELRPVPASEPTPEPVQEFTPEPTPLPTPVPTPVPTPEPTDMRNDSMPCDVNQILNMGDTASYYLYQTHHKEYMSTDGRNVDLYQKTGPHAMWHLQRVAHTTNRFYLVNDWANTYLHSSGNGNHDNVDLVRWTGEARDLQWLFFSAQEITAGAPKCTFYIMHSDSHKWLDTHGDNVHIWGDSSDMFAVGDSPQNLQWELRPVSASEPTPEPVQEFTPEPTSLPTPVPTPVPTPEPTDMRNDSMPCDVNQILNMGDTASYYLYQTHHKEYMSTDGRNVDLYQKTGPHAMWHLQRVAHTTNRFYLVNDWANTYLHSSGNGNHDNVDLVRWTGEARDLQWLFFSAQEITAGAPKCTFYIMHSDSHKWLDTHGDNVHIWGDGSDMFAVGDSPQNLQWELRPEMH